MIFQYSRFEGILNRDVEGKKTFSIRNIRNFDMTNGYLVRVQEGDTLSYLAYSYYGDARLWWLIADANNLNPFNLVEGLEIFIPTHEAIQRELNKQT